MNTCDKIITLIVIWYILGVFLIVLPWIKIVLLFVVVAFVQPYDFTLGYIYGQLTPYILQFINHTH